MIPPDVASNLRLILPDQQAATNAATQPVAQAARIADVLSNLSPGQRVLAEIQALLPNGNYRAIVAQRNVTLALPFSAKVGDSIELEVKESDGKLTLAFVANRSDGANAKAGQESVSTTLTSAGKLIGNLMTGIDGEGKRAPAAPLNGNQALVTTMPKNAAELVPVLKQALTQSGMFYEAHQAKWVAGQLPTEALRQEPQAKFSPLPISVAVNGLFEAKISSASNAPPSSLPGIEAQAKPLLATPPEPNALVQQKLNSAYSTSGSALLELPKADMTVTVNGLFEAKISSASNAPPSSLPGIEAQAKPLLATPPEPNALVQQKLNSAYSTSGSALLELPKADMTVTVNGVFEAKISSASNTPLNTLPGTEPQGKPLLVTPLEPNTLVQQKLNSAYSTSGSALLELPKADLSALSAQRPEQAASSPNNLNLPTSAPKTEVATPPTIAQISSGADPSSSTIAKTETATPPTIKITSGAELNSSSNAKTEATNQPPTHSVRAGEQASVSLQPGTPIPRELTPIVQQQLDGLANQNFAWQGQVWPGQQMEWQIGENPANARGQDAEMAQWQTRLKLSLPSLGGIDAVLQLRPNGEVGIAINTDNEVSETQLKKSADQLRSQFEAAGLSLSKLFIQHAQPAE